MATELPLHAHGRYFEVTALERVPEAIETLASVASQKFVEHRGRRGARLARREE